MRLVAMVPAQSLRAQKAAEILTKLQSEFATNLSEVGGIHSDFSKVTWLRDEGLHGGGSRLMAASGPMFNRASVNFSQVHYDDLPEKKLAAATALSTIIHPANPFAPSIHIHLSWTELRDGEGYWRVMADLNPSIPTPKSESEFNSILANAGKPYLDEALKNGDMYFYIPALKRHRGVAHYYLEGMNSGDFEADLEFTKNFGEAVIRGYPEIIKRELDENRSISKVECRQQLEYHSLYFLQVLTLDRGTTAGILVHNQNDLGILASLPSRVDLDLLASWLENLAEPQDQLLKSLIEILGGSGVAEIGDREKLLVVASIRSHYKKFPKAINMQAAGTSIPKTVSNHKS